MNNKKISCKDVCEIVIRGLVATSLSGRDSILLLRALEEEHNVDIVVTPEVEDFSILVTVVSRSVDDVFVGKVLGASEVIRHFLKCLTKN